MKNYDGWCVLTPNGKLLPNLFEETRTEIVRNRIGLIEWEEWRRDGVKIVKVKLVEVE